jgi:two-component system, sensor histidine kinase and response regulator
MTAHAISGDRDLCLAAGMDDHLTKPIDPASLLAAVARWGACGRRARSRTPMTLPAGEEPIDLDTQMGGDETIVD